MKKKIYLIFISSCLSFSAYSQTTSVIDTLFTDQWVNNGWVPSQRQKQSFSASCKNTTALGERADTSEGTLKWIKEFYSTNSYLPTDSIEKFQFQTWDTLSSSYINFLERHYYYNISNKLDSITDQTCIQGGCINSKTL
ncbi:MAG TPA: hypothetical protein VF622_06190, partial [Segetibacter sp.]